MPRRPREGRAHAPRGEETRAKILAAALTRFRKHGFDRTTMREIADDAGVALGGAYYYFPSKDAIVLAYYDQTQRLVASRVTDVFAKTTDVRERLGAAFHTRLDVLARDRKLLSGLFRSIADPSADLSIFAERTKQVREESISLFAEATSTSEHVATLDDCTRRIIALSFWSLQMGMLLYFIRDTSPKQDKTRKLVDHSLDLVCGLLPVAPQLAPMFGGQIARILAEAGLLG